MSPAQRNQNKKPPLIFTLLDTPAFGGAEQYLFGHLQHLRAHGFGIYLATNNESVRAELCKRLETTDHAAAAGTPFLLKKLPYRLDAIGNWKGLVKYFLSVPRACYWLVTALQRLRRDYQVICLLPGFTDRLTFSPLIKLMGLRLIWIDIAPLEPLFSRLWGFPKLLYHWAKLSPDHIVCTSQWTLDSIHRAAGVPRAKLTLIYPGIVPWSAQRIREFHTRGRRELAQRGLSDTLVVGYVGRLAGENEVDLVIKAVAALQQLKKLRPATRVPRLKLLIIGDGPNRLEYEQLADRLGIRELVHFTGFIEEYTKYSLLSCVDIFTFTRAWDLDGFGITTIEAMALGVSVITSDFGPQREVITHGVDGLRFQPHNWLDLAAHIACLASDAQLRNSVAARGTARVHEFAEQRLFNEMLEVVKRYGR